MEQKQGKKGYSIVSYQVRLYDRHFHMLQLTKELYSQVTSHFFNVLCLKKELLFQSDFQLLRELEVLCIGTKELRKCGKKPEFPLSDFPKIPLYFRRSAINSAITMARKYSNNSCSDMRECPKAFPMTLYQGMYRNLTSNSIELKLFDGMGWRWTYYPFSGREFPQNATPMSPTLVLKKKQAYLDVPMRFEVQDIRTIKERMDQEDTFCAIDFPEDDVSAVAVVLDKRGEEKAACFFRGGKEQEHHRKGLQKRLEKSKKSRKLFGPEENRRLYQDIQNLNYHYAHTISRQLLEYCTKQRIKIIVVPNYEEARQFQDNKYLSTNSYRWLGRSIIKKLKYKAFREGIVVTSVKPYKTGQICSECGALIHRYKEGHSTDTGYRQEKLFTCPNGHAGNVAENSAKNIGKQFLGYFKNSV